MAKYGKTYEPSFQKEMMGRSAEYCIQKMMERYGIKGETQALLDERLQFFAAALNETGFIEKPGACALVKLLKDAGIIIALATSAEPGYADAALHSLACHEAFSALTTGPEVAHGKPAPDIYLKAASKIGIAPEDCAAVEDAPAGVQSAKTAGMRVIGVADPRYVDALPEAALEVKSLKDLSVERFAGLFDSNG
jgi:HAD superfamily hydrolase (TIGR01509 family)